MAWNLARLRRYPVNHAPDTLSVRFTIVDAGVHDGRLGALPGGVGNHSAHGAVRIMEVKLCNGHGSWGPTVCDHHPDAVRALHEKIRHVIPTPGLE